MNYKNQINEIQIIHKSFASYVYEILYNMCPKAQSELIYNA